MTKVLIIEDDPIIASIYRNRLHKEGFEVEIASDGQSGLNRIHESCPDALLLDLMLPKMDGIQILRNIRASREFADLPVIVFTNAYVQDMIQEAITAGATYVFNKASLTPGQLMEAFCQAFAARPTTIESPDAQAVSNETIAPLPSVEPAEVSQLPGDLELSASAPPAGNDSTFIPATAPGEIQPTPAEELAPPETEYAPGPGSEPENQLAALARSSQPPDTTPAIDTTRDQDEQQNLRYTFKAATPEVLASMRKLLHDFLKHNEATHRLSDLNELYRKIHALTGNAALTGLANIAQMCAALEALVKELKEKPNNINPSTMRTITHAVDFLGLLLEQDPGTNLLETPPVNILVVDDEVISRRAVVYALEKGGLKSESMEDPVAASQQLAAKSYDLIILDVDMPGMTGFELCSQLRAFPSNQNTPVIFVTSLTDFESRARSSLSGGNDLIAKPFLFIELTVKALAFVLRHRLAQMQA